MKILFFGDFHFDSTPSSGGLHIEYAESVADDPIMLLIDPLKARYEKEKISLMVFMGDYGKGKDTAEKKRTAFKRIKNFVDTVEKYCCGIFDHSENLKNRIIFLDGNHDVSRDANHHQIFEEVFGTYLGLV